MPLVRFAGLPYGVVAADGMDLLAAWMENEPFIGERLSCHILLIGVDLR